MGGAASRATADVVVHTVEDEAAHIAAQLATPAAEHALPELAELEEKGGEKGLFGQLGSAAGHTACVATRNPVKALLGAAGLTTLLGSAFGSEHDRRKAFRDPLSAIANTICNTVEVVTFQEGSCAWTTYVGPGVVFLLVANYAHISEQGTRIGVALAAGSVYYLWGEGKI